jgi:lysophospholipase L1-like esterase
MLRLSRLAAAAAVLLCASVVANAQNTPRVLVFGDSNTFGLSPLAEGQPRVRYAPTVRWTGVLRAELGAGVTVIDDGLIGRSIDRDEPSGLGGTVLNSEHFNGSRSLPVAAASQVPLDLVVIMLGTNDIAAKYGRDVDDIARSAVTLARDVPRVAAGWLPSAKPPRVVIVTPPPINGEITFAPFRQLWPDGSTKAKALRAALAREATAAGIEVVHVGDVVSSVGTDGVHMTPENHAALGRHVASAVRRLLAP